MIELHQALQKDYDFLYELKKKTLKEYVSKTWGWDEKWQRDYHSQNFKPELVKIITISGKDIGCISIIEEEDRFFLSIIEILPKYQNQGIGTDLITNLLSKAKVEQKDVYLQVLISNRKAQKLYKRLGFKIEEKTDTHHKMVFQS
ncbi:MAG: GNAT family N-acetyltransferase [Promethearchaeota archaeon]|jgi:ribosomal protein S18 acetylase RimI-like enzyme